MKPRLPIFLFKNILFEIKISHKTAIKGEHFAMNKILNIYLTGLKYLNLRNNLQRFHFFVQFEICKHVNLMNKTVNFVLNKSKV